jgi:indole-3-glycerol phosphate synthase
LRRLVPPDVVLVAESGIHGAGDARRMREAGADAILVGELLMRSEDPASQIREMTV